MLALKSCFIFVHDLLEKYTQKTAHFEQSRFVFTRNANFRSLVLHLVKN